MPSIMVLLFQKHYSPQSLGGPLTPPHTTDLLLSSWMGAPRGDQMAVIEDNLLSPHLTRAHMFPLQRTNLPH